MTESVVSAEHTSSIECASTIARECGLHGRDRHLAQLLDAVGRVSRGRGEVSLLPGQSGTGKTALANALREPVKARNGFFLEGKFNQYDRNVAFVAWRQALAEFCAIVCREDASTQRKWAQHILDAVAGQGQVLVDLVPEFEQLLGKQSAVDGISPQESRHRFTRVIRDTLGVICRPEHPVLLFIDDWQWADPASLDLLSQLQLDSTLRYVLLVAAYRSDEVDAGHRFLVTLDKLRSERVSISSVPVESLSPAEVELLVEGHEIPLIKDVPALAADIHEATGGNAFFAHALLDSIRSNPAFLEATPGESVGSSSVDFPTEIVELFARQIDALPPITQELLTLASCLGHRFEVNTLAMIAGHTASDCIAALSPAAELLVRLDRDSEKQPGEVYRFAHDRVQQAAYSRIAKQDIPATRLGIARQMLAQLGDEELHAKVCEVADHLNAGASLLESQSEILRGVELNVQAARKARNATAFSSALQYHREAQRLIAQDGRNHEYWEHHHSLAFTLQLEHAETEFLEGDPKSAESLIREAVEHAQTSIQKADALTTLVVQHTLQARYEDAIATAREALAAIGFELPQGDFEEARDLAIQETKRLMEGRSVSDVIDMAPASDEVMQTAAKVLITMGPPCYRAHQRLWSVIVPRVVNLTLKYGHIPQIGYSHTAMAGLLGWVSNDFDSGHAFCEIADRVMTPLLASSADESVFHLMMGSSAHHWYGHLRESTNYYQAAIETGRQSGNLQYAAYAFGHNMYCRFFQGAYLEDLTGVTEHSLAFSRTRHNQWAIDLLEGGIQIVNELWRGDEAGEAAEDWEATYLKSVEAHQNQQVACIYYVMKSQQSLLQGNHEEAFAYSEKAAPLIFTVGTQGLLPWPEYVFARALAIGLMRNKSNTDSLAPELCEEVGRLLDQLAIWAKQCPENFEHKFHFASAVWAGLSGTSEHAAELLDQAILSAQENGFLQWEALANEIAADYWGTRGEGRLQQVYWQRAFSCFKRWGAIPIVNRMEAGYRESIATAKRRSTETYKPTKQGSDHAVERFSDRHLEWLRHREAQLAKANDQEKVLQAAGELASATDALRLDVATGRRTVSTLQQQAEAEQAINQELERRVQERTVELERAAQNLQLSEHRFRTSVEAAPVGMVIINAEGDILVANAALCSLFGYEQKELVGQKIELLVPAKYRAGHVSQRDSFFASPVQRPMGAGRDLCGVHKDGTEVPVELGLTPIALDEGMGAIGTVVDLTARKKAEKSLSESEERHRLVVDGVMDYSIIWLDPTGRITSWNSGAERILGYSADEILGEHISRFYSEDAIEAGHPANELRAAAKDGRIEEEDWRIRKNGERFWANVIVTAVRDNGGSLIGFSKITRDLTERMRAEKAIQDANESLKESQALLRTLIDESMNFKGLMTTDGTLIDANRTALHSAGVNPEDVLNRKFVDTPWWQHSEELQQRLTQSIESAAAGQADGFEATHLDLDGNVIHVDFSLKPVKNETGDVIYLIPEGRDMTLHKQRELELHRLYAEVKKSNDELEQFAYVASHDLQEPLRKISSYCKLLQEEQSENLDEEGREYLEVAMNGAGRLQILVRDLLTFSRITTRGKPLSVTSASESLQEATTNLSMLIEEKSAVVTNDELPEVWADSGQLTHLFQNLVGNAIKYCDRPVPEVHVGVRDLGEVFEFYVQDNGIGIDSQFYEQIFQVFQRLHNRREYSGTGIGLALCKRIVERFGGTIRVESTPGVGSKFYFTIGKATNERRHDVRGRHTAPIGATH